MTPVSPLPSSLDTSVIMKHFAILVLAVAFFVVCIHTTNSSPVPNHVEATDLEASPDSQRVERGFLDLLGGGGAGKKGKEEKGEGDKKKKGAKKGAKKGGKEEEEGEEEEEAKEKPKKKGKKSEEED